VLPYVLLLNTDEEDGYVRRWKPPDSGTSTHYGYAFQWFAMALALFGLMVWNLKNGLKNNDD
jgi:surfeit locus 1 family protein